MPQSPEKAYEDMDYAAKAEYHAQAARQRTNSELRTMNVGLSQTYALLAIGDQISYLTYVHQHAT